MLPSEPNWLLWHCLQVEKAPLESYADVGGLEQQITEIKEAVELPLTHPELYEDIGIKPPKVRLHKSSVSKLHYGITTGCFRFADMRDAALSVRTAWLRMLCPCARVTVLHAASPETVGTLPAFVCMVTDVPVSRCMSASTVAACVLQGVILYGEPGTGKTLLAKAVANSTSATFLRVVGSELIQKYLGDGPKLVRELFRVADDLAPSIVFIGMPG